MKKRCRHPHTKLTWANQDGVYVRYALHCHTCGERLSLGPSNDAPAAVTEGRAAELAAASVDPWYEVCPGIALTAEAWGWSDHETGGSDEDGWHEWHAGWLARELATHDHRDERDAKAWSWDREIPVALQGPGSIAVEQPVDEPTAKEIDAFVGLVSCMEPYTEFSRADAIADEIRASGARLTPDQVDVEVDRRLADEADPISAVAIHEAMRALDPDPRDDDHPDPLVIGRARGCADTWCVATCDVREAARLGWRDGRCPEHVTVAAKFDLGGES